jgi:hypothetical protein
MKKALLTMGVCLMLASAAQATTLAFWHFDDQTQLASGVNLWRINPLGTPDAHAEYFRDIGVASAELSTWSYDGLSDGNLVGINGATASAEENNNFGSFQGNTLNDIRDTPLASGSLSILGSSNNGRYFQIEIDDAISGATLTYATRGTGTGFNLHDWSYSTDGGQSFAPLASHAAQTSSTWVVHTVNIGELFASTSGDDINVLRMTVSGATTNNGNNRLDNILLSGEIVPEPASLALLALGGLFMARRR